MIVVTAHAGGQHYAETWSIRIKRIYVTTLNTRISERWWYTRIYAVMYAWNNSGNNNM